MEIGTPRPYWCSVMRPTLTSAPVLRAVKNVLGAGLLVIATRDHESSSEMEGTCKARVESIDLPRGAVIILMALDHLRMYFGQGTWWAEPANLDATAPPLFLTRWSTH
jgi:hypothetical protein